jgi:hypothetical protein
MKVKGKVVPLHAMKAYKVSKLWFHPFSLALREGDWLTLRSDRFGPVEIAPRW